MKYYYSTVCSLWYVRTYVLHISNSVCTYYEHVQAVFYMYVCLYTYFVAILVSSNQMKCPFKLEVEHLKKYDMIC